MGVTSFNDAWFAVRAQPRKELLAEMHLRRQSFETFFP
ncbi:MAG: transcriptional activator RfaH, partial [Alphaproteobacteria bacterium]|nr:transcriptional activator RfaH [Alphaproteobacteria bacterium]